MAQEPEVFLTLVALVRFPSSGVNIWSAGAALDRRVWDGVSAQVFPVRALAAEPFPTLNTGVWLLWLWCLQVSVYLAEAAAALVVSLQGDHLV